jgi:hypothetical protein
LAVDLSRPLNDSIITLTHEIIHAADPHLISSRQRFSELERGTKEIIRKILGDIKQAEGLSDSLVNHVLYEAGYDTYINELSESRKRRINNLQEAVNESHTYRLTESESKLLGEYFSSLIELTVGNEYRAYGFSLLVYLELKNQLQLIPPSRNRLKIIERFLSGDSVFVANLANVMNPFKDQRVRQLFAEKLDPRITELLRRVNRTDASTRQDEQPKPLTDEEKDILEQYKRMTVALNSLEIAYLNSLDRFISQMRNRFQDPFQKFSDAPENSLIPYFARPGGMKSPMNPYQILTARFTTAWVLRFRVTLADTYSAIVRLNEPFAMTAIGLLDLHDISVGERQLLGLAYQNLKNRTQSLTEELRTPYESLPDALKSEFSFLTSFSLDLDKATVISEEDLQQRLLKLRLLKTSLWLDENTPVLRATVTSVGNFLELIQNGSYDKEDISFERAQELKAELESALASTQLSRNEIERMIVLIQVVGHLVEWARNNQSTALSSDLDQKLQGLLRVFENLRIRNQNSEESYTSDLHSWIEQFDAQMKPHAKMCQEQMKHNPSRLLFYGISRPFLIGPYQFPLTSICYAGRLHLVRQPGDYYAGMTTIIQDGRPISRIMNDSPPVAIRPYSPKTNQKRRTR